MKKIIILFAICILFSCEDGYLDVVPDNVTTVADAFQNRNYTKNYLYTCYSYIPSAAMPDKNPAMVAGDEVYYDDESVKVKYSGNVNSSKIARGLQNSSFPYVNYWDGGSGGHSLWEAIRTCNTFLENVDTPVDLNETEKRRWISEVIFLKAYFHYYLFQLYGAIPILDENLPLNASVDEVKVYREPVDEVVDYIVTTIDKSLENLPEKITSEISELGRVTKPIALAVKAKVLILAASPLFNGNSDLVHLTDNRGKQLFPSEEPNKWVIAEKALKEAIDAAHQSGAKLFDYRDNKLLDDKNLPVPLLLSLNIRQSVCEKWNSELIWGSTESTRQIQINCAAKLTTQERKNGSFAQFHSPTMRIAEQFYSSNGVPISEDKDWVENGWYSDRFNSRLSTPEDNHQYYLKEGDYSAVLHFNREPRFYGTLGFHNGIWFRSDEEPYVLNGLVSGYAGPYQNEDFSATGYYSKKLVSIETKPEAPYGIITESYSFPHIRLADLYLLYAEVLNEVGNKSENEIFEYVDLVRAKYGLDGVISSWTNYSVNPGKYTSQQGRREIIHQERLIELALEGQRYWDLRRWKKLSDEMNKPLFKWNIYDETVGGYFRRVALEFRSFEPKDYLWPIKSGSIDVNNNLVQNPGW